MYVQYAVRSKDTKIISELLDCGIDVNDVTNYSTLDNALTCSSRLKDLDTVRLLLQRGASTTHVNSEG
jgi:ankyrin repeat protein